MKSDDTVPVYRPRVLETDEHGGDPTIRTRFGGSCGTTPFYLMAGQDTPEYDQGDAVIVWYDDLCNLAQRAR